MTKVAIEHVDPSTLTPAPYNPRIMSDDARARLKRGIEQFGLVDPLIVRRSDRLVVGGHQRLSVALDLKMPTVPVVFLDDLNDHDTAALNVLLNNPNAQGAWDFPKLTELLSTLDGEGYDVTMTGFDSAELTHMLGDDWKVPEPGGAEGDDAQEAMIRVRCRPQDANLVRDTIASALAAFEGARVE